MNNLCLSLQSPETWKWVITFKMCPLTKPVEAWRGRQQARAARGPQRAHRGIFASSHRTLGGHEAPELSSWAVEGAKLTLSMSAIQGASRIRPQARPRRVQRARGRQHPGQDGGQGTCSRECEAQGPLLRATSGSSEHWRTELAFQPVKWPPRSWNLSTVT